MICLSLWKKKRKKDRSEHCVVDRMLNSDDSMTDRKIVIIVFRVWFVFRPGVFDLSFQPKNDRVILTHV